MNTFQLTTPVAFIIFNRPDTTRVVFEAIRLAKPPRLFVIADGPRPHKEGEIELCRQTRAIIDQVDWPCQVYYNFSDQNMGCRKRVSSGLDWVFQHVEQAIILEDDCLPAPSFFRYCEELLQLYKDDKRIMMISGNNFQESQRCSDYDYYFSQYTHIWGWATWKRAWACYDHRMEIWEQIREGNWLMDILRDEAAAEYWFRRFEDTYNGKVDSWAYVWSLSCWVNSGLTILPNVNLVSNIGFGENASHTKNVSTLANLPTESLRFPLRHPPYVIQDVKSDKYTDRAVFHIDASHYKEMNILNYYKTIWLDFLLLYESGITSVLKKEGINKVAVFGTEKTGIYLREDLKKSGIELISYLDNNKSKQNTLIGNIPVNKPTWVAENNGLVDAVIVSIEGNHDKQVLQDLRKLSQGTFRVYSWKELLRMKIEESKFKMENCL